MINSCLIKSNTRAALAARDILSIRRRGAVAALITVLALGVGWLVGTPAVHAQTQAPAVDASVAAAGPAVTTVNINTADAQMLAATLKGVGQARAMEIVRYREAYGPFASIEELTEVKGIGRATLEQNRNAITLE